MLKSIIAALGRALAWTAQTAAEIVMAPVHGVLQFLFPALYEPAPGEYIECEVNDGSLPVDLGFDPFANIEEVREARELETTRVLTWAADAAYSGAEVPLPSVRPELRAWLSSLSGDELEVLVLAGQPAVHGHIHFSLTIPGMPLVHEKGHRREESAAGFGWDPTVTMAAFARAC